MEGLVQYKWVATTATALVPILTGLLPVILNPTMQLPLEGKSFAEPDDFTISKGAPYTFRPDSNATYVVEVTLIERTTYALDLYTSRLAEPQ